VALRHAQFEALGCDYRQRLRQRRPGGPHHAHAPQRGVDKALHNFALLGLIHLALPQARFIHVRRAPLDTCLSCFSKGFDDAPFSSELGELARCCKAWGRWRSSAQ
jgi:hypothetical protein